MKRIIVACLFAALSWSTAARAEVDTFGIGTGPSPFPSPAPGDNVINDYAPITSVFNDGLGNVSAVNITTSNPGAFQNLDGFGTLVMLWNPLNPSAVGQTDVSSVDISASPVGQWELALGTLAGVKLTFTKSLTPGFSATVVPGVTQVIRVPQYLSMTIPAGSNIVPAKWNGSIGGVLAFLVNGPVTVVGQISADNAGFAGGTASGFFDGGGASCAVNDTNAGEVGFRGDGVAGTGARSRANQANAGGGGLCTNAGGGGGGNGNNGVGRSGGAGGAAASGGANTGHGGATLLFSLIDHFSFGGGGGAGQLQTAQGPSDGVGGAGGGAIFFRAASLTGGGSIHSDGETPASSTLTIGQGGGGAGGSIYIRLTGALTSICNSIHANGGTGGVSSVGSVGIGGSGGGGQIFIQSTSTCASANANGGGGGSPGATGNITTNRSSFCGTSADCSGTSPICGLVTPGVCAPCSGIGQCPAADPVCVLSGGPVGSCAPCATNGDCVAATLGTLPFCSAGTCQRCDTGGASTQTADLRCNTDPTKPICEGNGTCGNCSVNTDCSTRASSTPFCNAVTSGGDGSCRGCATSTECQTDISTTTPICSAGSCVACSGNPACDTAFPKQPFCLSGACVACNAGGPSQQAADLRCTVNGARPICQGDGSCAGCGAPAECQTRAATTPICNSGSCVACSGNASCDTNYPALPVCSAGACIGCSGIADCNVDSNRPACTVGGCVRCDQSTGEAVCTPSGKHCEDSASSSFHGACVGCRSDNNSGDCSVAKPVCNASDVCETCSGSNNGENICLADYSPGTPHCIAGGGACVQCNVSLTDCTSSKPVCGASVANVCGNCSSDADCNGRGVLKVCALAGPSTGACVGCVQNSDCSQALPHCSGDISAPGSCGACTGDNDCTGYPGALACQPNDGITNSPGQCKQCSFDNTAACTGSTPACNFVIGSCQLCTVEKGDLGAQSTGCAANTDGHACQGSGTSVFCGCTTDADCGNNTSGRICDNVTHLCADGCSRAPARNNCPTGQFCTSDDTSGTVPGVCTTTCNFDIDCSSTMPTMQFCINGGTDDGGTRDAGSDGGNMGVSADGGIGRCAGCRDDGDCSGTTPVCEPAMKVCVQCTTAETNACTATGAGTACLTDETCGCTDDSQCGASDSGRICDLLKTQKCIAGCRVLGGNGCPSGLVCSGSGLVPGSCVEVPDMAMNIPDLSAGPEDLSVPVDMTETGFKLKGGGFGCDVNGGSAASSWGSLLLLAAAMLALRWRRRAR